jgi:hypothetical protein
MEGWISYLGEVESWISVLTRTGLAAIEAESADEADRTVAALDLPVLQFSGFVVLAFHYPKNHALQGLVSPEIQASMSEGGKEASELARRIDPLAEAFSRRTRDALDRLSRLGGPGEPIALGTRVVLESAAYGSPDRELLGRLRACSPWATSGLTRYFLTSVLAAPLLVGVSISNLKEGERRDTLAAIARLAPQVFPQLEPVRRQDLFEVLLMAGEKTLFQCEADTGAPELDSFDLLLDLVEAQDRGLRTRLRPVAAACERISKRPFNRRRTRPAIASRLARLYQATGHGPGTVPDDG